VSRVAGVSTTYNSVVVSLLRGYDGYGVGFTSLSMCLVLFLRFSDLLYYQNELLAVVTYVEVLKYCFMLRPVRCCLL